MKKEKFEKTEKPENFLDQRMTRRRFLMDVFKYGAGVTAGAAFKDKLKLPDRVADMCQRKGSEGKEGTEEITALAQALRFCFSFIIIIREMQSYWPDEQYREDVEAYRRFLVEHQTFLNYLYISPEESLSLIKLLDKEQTLQNRYVAQELSEKGAKLLNMEPQADSVDIIKRLGDQEKAIDDDEANITQEIPGLTVNRKGTTMSLIYRLPTQEDLPDRLRQKTEFYTSFDIEGFIDPSSETSFVPTKSRYHAIFVNDDNQGVLTIRSDERDLRVFPACVNEEWMPDTKFFDEKKDNFGFLVLSLQGDEHIKATFVPMGNQPDRRQQTIITSAGAGAGYEAEVGDITEPDADKTWGERIESSYVPCTKVIPLECKF